MTTPHKQPPHGNTKRPNTPDARPIDASKDGEHGEGSYSGTRDYRKSVKEYLKHADVEKDARDAAPDTAEEAKEMTDAEREARDRAAGSDRAKEK
jgi:hypothetical protein